MRTVAVIGALACCGPAASVALAVPSASAAAVAHSEGRQRSSVSANWAGYVATPPAGAGSRFSSASGEWRQPGATCSPGRETDSAVWVGLGGYSETARGLEQVGTDADCTASGSAVYSSWFELIPAEPVNLKLAVHPGDAIVASVTIDGRDVTLRIRNLTTGGRFSITKHATNLDASSAEWIVEAPSLCVSGQTCDVLPLTDFGQLAFTSATAVAHNHTGAIVDPDWSEIALELRQPARADTHGRTGAHVLPTRTLTVATPSPSTSPNGAFSVSWQQQT